MGNYAKHTFDKYSSDDIAIDSPGTELFISCNEAVARGAIEAGVRVAASYPGSPLAYVIDNLVAAAKVFPEMHVEWSSNEKVALEVAIGGTMCGVRSFTPMKNVGMNVLLDALVSISTLGPSGLVLVIADDPGAETTGNEQDTRFLAKFCEIPVLEPSTMQECKDFIVRAFELSEEIKLPVIVRVTVRLGYGRQRVVLGPINHEARQRVARFDRNDPYRWSVMAPFRYPYAGYAKQHQRFHEEADAEVVAKVQSLPTLKNMTEKIAALTEHKLIYGNGNEPIVVITAGLVTQEVIEAIHNLQSSDNISIFKLATSYPLPYRQLMQLLKGKKEVLVVEEIEPFIEEQIRSMALDLEKRPRIIGKISGHLPYTGELDRGRIGRVLAEIASSTYCDPCSIKTVEKGKDMLKELNIVSPRRFCAGCPEHAALYALKQFTQSQAIIGCGDIGCYEMAENPPFRVTQSGIWMGGGLSIGTGMYHAGVSDKVLALVGDSTFFHTGLPALANAVYNKANILLVVMDNGTTGETGHQPHPGAFGITATGLPTKVLDIVDIARAFQVDFLAEVDPFDVAEMTRTFREALDTPGVSVVVSRRICTLVAQRQQKNRYLNGTPCMIDSARCVSCNICIDQYACPAMKWQDGKPTIDPEVCVGCMVCMQVCPNNAIGLEVHQ